MCNTFLHSSKMVLFGKDFSQYIQISYFLKFILRAFSSYHLQFSSDKCHMNLITKCHRSSKIWFSPKWLNFCHQLAKSMYPAKIPDSKKQAILKDF